MTNFDLPRPTDFDPTDSPFVDPPSTLAPPPLPAADRALGPARTMDQILELKTAARQTVRIVLDMDAKHRLEEIERQVDALQRRARLDPNFDRSQLEELQADGLRLLDHVEEMTQTFTFMALGRKRVENQMSKMRPSQAQVQEFKAELRRQGQPTNQPLPYDPHKFPIWLIAEASVEPKITEGQAEEMWDGDAWSKGELATIWAAAWACNEIVG